MDGRINSLECKGSIWDISTLKSGLYILQTFDGYGSVLGIEKILIE